MADSKIDSWNSMQQTELLLPCMEKFELTRRAQNSRSAEWHRHPNGFLE